MGDMSAAYCFFRDGIRKIQVKYSSIRPVNKSPEFIRIYSKANRMREPGTVARFKKHLMDFEKFCRTHEITPVYVYIPLADSFRLDDLLRSIGMDPRDFDASYYEKLMESYCAKRGVKLVNLRPVLKEYFDQGKQLRFDLDGHFNDFANRVIGEFLVEEVFGKDAVRHESGG